MVTVLCIIYTALVALLFKFKLLKLRPYPIAWVAVGGILLIGGVVVAWHLCAPMSSRVVTTQYVVQLVSYVKGHVLKVHAQANQPVKKGDLLLEINPEPFQYTVNQVEAQLAAAKDNVKQSQAALEAADANVVKTGAGINQAEAALTQSKAALANAQANRTKVKAGLVNAQAGVVKAKASDDLAKTEEQIALKLQKMDAGAVSTLRVAQAVQNREAADAAVKQAKAGVEEAEAGVQQAEAGVNQAHAAVMQAEAGLAEAQSGQRQAEAADRQARFALQMAQSNVPAVSAIFLTASVRLHAGHGSPASSGLSCDTGVLSGTSWRKKRRTRSGQFRHRGQRPPFVGSCSRRCNRRRRVMVRSSQTRVVGLIRERPSSHFLALKASEPPPQLAQQDTSNSADLFRSLPRSVPIAAENPQFFARLRNLPQALASGVCLL
jgi:multidrug resistance efflux pump